VVAELMGFGGCIASERAEPVDRLGGRLLELLSASDDSWTAPQLARELRVGVAQTLRALDRLVARRQARRESDRWVRAS